MKTKNIFTLKISFSEQICCADESLESSDYHHPILTQHHDRQEGVGALAHGLRHAVTLAGLDRATPKQDVVFGHKVDLLNKKHLLMGKVINTFSSNI
jgi:hypothetical protein